MQINWKKAESLSKPIEIDSTSSIDGVYIRKNITNETRIGSDEQEYTVFCYDEAFLTHSEYERYMLVNDLTSSIELKHENDIIDNYTLQLIEGGIL